MGFKVLFSDQAAKDIKKLDKPTKIILGKWLNKHLVECDNPRVFGKGIASNKAGLWRYKIGNYRLICDIKDEELIILALTFKHRSEVYE